MLSSVKSASSNPKNCKYNKKVNYQQSSTILSSMISSSKNIRSLFCKGNRMIDSVIIIFQEYYQFKGQLDCLQLFLEMTMRLESVNQGDSNSKITLDECIEIEKNSQQSGRPNLAKEHIWTYEEQSIYCQFLKDNLKSLSSPKLRKKLRIFKAISTLLGTRTPIQVKSHHQKLENKYHITSKVILHLERQLSRYRPSQKLLNAEEIMNVCSTSQQIFLFDHAQVTIEFDECYFHSGFDLQEDDDLFFS